MKREEELHTDSLSATTASQYATGDVFSLPAVLHPLSVKIDVIDRKDPERFNLDFALQKYQEPGESR